MAGMTLLAADQLDWYVGKPWAMICRGTKFL